MLQLRNGTNCLYVLTYSSWTVGHSVLYPLSTVLWVVVVVVVSGVAQTGPILCPTVL